jgi:hypothetical protein
MRIVALILAAAVASPALAADSKVQQQVGADKDKLICKREVPIGSLIASRKTCLTKAQWVQREKDGNEEARKMIYDNQGRPTSN